MALSTVGVLARGARLCVGILVALAYSAAWADVDQAFLEKAENLLKAGKAEDAYQMLEAVEVQAAGDLVYDYLLGTAALQTNRPSKATFVYERILAVAPSYIGVRADMGRAYFALGDYGRAKIEFETVLTFQNLPLDLRTSVEQYAKAADAYAQKRRTVGNGYIELGYGRDNNITGANEALTLNYPGTPPTIVAGAYSPGRKSDNYYALGLGGEVNHQMTDRWGSYIGADYRGRAYENFCDNTCNWSLDARGGLSYSGGAWLIKTGLTGGTYELNKKTYRDSLGLAVDWRMALTSGNQLSANISSTRTSYLDTHIHWRRQHHRQPVCQRGRRGGSGRTRRRQPRFLRATAVCAKNLFAAMGGLCQRRTHQLQIRRHQSVLRGQARRNIGRCDPWPDVVAGQGPVAAAANQLHQKYQQRRVVRI